MSQIDRVLDDVALVLQRGVDVDGSVGDKERPRIAGRVDRIDMAYAPVGAQAEIGVNNRAHQLVGMERAFHQRFDLAGAGHGDGLHGRGVAVLGRDNFVGRQIEPGLRGSGADFSLRANQHRHDQFGARRLDGAEQRRRVDRMNNRRTDGIEAAGRLDQEFVAAALFCAVRFRAAGCGRGRFFRSGAMTSAVPVMTSSPCWFVARQSNMTRCVSSIFFVTFTVTVIVSPSPTGRWKCSD